MISSNSVDELFPVVKRAALELARRMKEQGFPIGISSTYRDDEAQDALYAQGRTKPGNIVTNAPGGQSMHNYRLAFDIFHDKTGDEYNSNVLRLVGAEAEKMGLEWGGSWAGLVDMTHVHWTEGLTLAQLQSGKRPEDKKLAWETRDGHAPPSLPPAQERKP